MKSTGVYGCPDDATTPDATPTAAGGNGVVAGSPFVKVSYALNGAFMYGIPGHNPTDGAYTNQSTWSAPASTVMLMEVSNCEAQVTNPTEDQSPTNDGLSGGGDFDSYSPGGGGNNGVEQTGIQGSSGDGNPPAAVCAVVSPPTSPGCAASLYGLHTNGSNYLLCDGHVKWLLGTHVSPELAALTPISVEGSNYGAAGTSVSTNNNGGPIAATYSPN